MAIFTLFIFVLKHVKNKYNRIVRTDLSLHLSRFHHGGRGLDGDRRWAGLEHYTPGLKMDSTLALLLLHHDCTYFFDTFMYTEYIYLSSDNLYCFVQNCVFQMFC